MRTRLLASFLGIAALGLGSSVLGTQAHGAVASLPKVAVYTSDHVVETFDVVEKLTNTGLFSTVDNLSPVSCGDDPVPSLATLEQYAAVLVWSNCGWYDLNTLGNTLADYVDAGGRVVVATHDFLAGSTEIGGRFATGGYLPLSTGGFACCVEGYLAADLPSHPLLAGVSSFDGNPGSIHDNNLSLTQGTTLVAHWTSDSEPLVTCKGSVVGLNFYPPSSDVGGPDYWNKATDGVRLMTNALTAPCSGTLTVVKHLVSSAFDPARFNLKIDGTTDAANVGNGGTTGAVTVVPGSHIVSETAGRNAVLANYGSRITCSNGATGVGTSLSVNVASGADVTCTITNTRKLRRG